MQILDDGGRKLLRAYVREELLKVTGRPEDHLSRVEAQLAGLKAEADRLLANLTEANREFIDDRLIVIKGQRRELEARQEALRAATRRAVDVDEAVDEAMGYLGRFRDVLAQGTFLEQKEFLRCFVVGVDLDPAAKQGTLHMHNMVAASFLTSGWNRPKLYRRSSGASIRSSREIREPGLMPIFEYGCEACGERFEKLVLAAFGASEAVACTRCGSERVSRQVSTFSARSGSGAATGDGNGRKAPAGAGGGCCSPGSCGCH